MKLIKLMGATVTDKDNGEREYKPRGPVWIRPEAVTAVYEHMVRTEHHQFVVMQTCAEILRRLNGGRAPGQGAVIVEYSEGHMPQPLEEFAERAAEIEKQLAEISEQVKRTNRRVLDLVELSAKAEKHQAAADMHIAANKEVIDKALGRLLEVERRLNALDDPHVWTWVPEPKCAINFDPTKNTAGRPDEIVVEKKWKEAKK